MGVFVWDVIVVLLWIICLIDLCNYGLHNQIHHMRHTADLCILRVELKAVLLQQQDTG